MKILHICLGCFYIDGYNYQENVLPRINKEDGHEVKIIASTETFINNNKLGHVEPSEYVTEYGVPIKRLPYTKIGNNFITTKLRKYQNIYKEIIEFNPDIILSHDLCYYSVLDVIKYKKEHPQVKFYADSHTDANNSGTNWISLNILHRIFYKFLVQKAIPYLEKYFYLSEETRIFNKENYGVPDEIMEFYPLGGTIFSEEERLKKRNRKRKELQIKEDEILFCHSGKMDKLKRTEDLLRAFYAVKDEKLKLIIVGSIPDDMKNILLPLMERDKRINYLGWKSSDELLEYLCACDVYCQPGGQSATMQNAVCCGCAMMLYPHISHKVYDYGNILWVKDQESIGEAFKNIAEKQVDLQMVKEGSFRCGSELLDYRKLAARLYQ